MAAHHDGVQISIMEEPKGESYHRNVVLYGILTVFLQNVIKRILGFLHPSVFSGPPRSPAEPRTSFIVILFASLRRSKGRMP